MLIICDLYQKEKLIKNIVKCLDHEQVLESLRCFILNQEEQHANSMTRSSLKSHPEGKSNDMKHRINENQFF